MTRVVQRAHAQSPYGPLALAACLGAALIAGDQVLQVAVSIQEAGTGPGWRFQLATSWVARAVPLLVVCFVLWAAIQARPTAARFLPALYAVAALLAISFAVGGAVMWFDGPAVRAGLQADDLAAFVAIWVRGLLMASLGSVCLAAIAFLMRKTRS